MTWLLLLACQSPIIEVDYLAVTALSPQNEAGDIAVDAEMLVTFSEPLVSESVDDTTVLLSATDGTPIAIDVRYAETDNTVIATPMDPLAYDAAYTFVISSEVEGEETGAMPSDVLTRFRTGVPSFAKSNTVASSTDSETSGPLNVTSISASMVTSPASFGGESAVTAR